MYEGSFYIRRIEKSYRSKNGIFQFVQPELLGASVLKDLIKKYEIDKIDEIICGNAVGTGGNIARLMTLTAGVSNEVPAFTVDMQCASAMMSIDIAFQRLNLVSVI